MQVHINKPHAVIFDWDNTLIDSWSVIHSAMNITLERMGHEIWSRGEIEKRVRASLRDSFPSLFGARWKDAEKIFYESFESIHLKELQPLPGAHDLLNALKEVDMYLAVVSNKRGSLLRKEAKHLGWDHYFHSLTGAGDATRDKPAIDPVIHALAGGGILPGPGVWFIGDTDIDLICAKNSGCTPILLRQNAPQPDEFLNAVPAFYYSSCQALAESLVSLRSQ